MYTIPSLLAAGTTDCEADSGGILIQPVSAVSSLAFAIAGLVILTWARSVEGHERTVRILFGFAMVATGIGSFLFHGYDSTVAQFLHDITFLATVWFLAVVNVMEVRGWQRFWGWIIVIAGIAIFSITLLVAPGLTNIFTILVTIVLIASDVQLEHSGGIARPWWIASLVAMSLAVALFLLGRTGAPLCDPDSLFQGHALWHALSAAAIAFYFVATSTHADATGGKNVTHISQEEIAAAHRRIGPYVHRTPIATSTYIDDRVGASVFFKCENLQKIGAFKARGATNAVLSLDDATAARGVVTHSSGNHGQAVAYACAIRDIPAVVVMPDDAATVKVDAVRGYGANVVLVPRPEREARVAQIVESDGLTLVHPFNDIAVIAGQATASLELIEDVPDLDVILAPIGGGGLMSGTSLVASSFGIEAVGVEPTLVDDAYRSLRDGIRYPATGELSVGDGLLTGLGEITFAILSAACIEVVLVSETEILDAVRTVATRMKLIVEPSGATVVAALMAERDRFVGRRVGAIFSGGNLDLQRLAM